MTYGFERDTDKTWLSEHSAGNQVQLNTFISTNNLEVWEKGFNLISSHDFRHMLGRVFH